MRKVDYDPDHLSDFDREWGLHRGCNEWWYCTGALTGDAGQEYSYQFTLIEVGSIPWLSPNVIMLALTDMQSGEHHYLQNLRMFGSEMTLTPELLQFDERARLVKGKDSIALSLHHQVFSLDLHLDYGKGAVWHCDRGKLWMGSTGDPRNTTFYFSYPNMPTTGWLRLGDQKVAVRGKTWFDKQGGPFNLTDRQTHWEWFSLRFEDDEEMMLFTFPQMDYYDGTYIRQDGRSQRLNQYQIRTLNTIGHNGQKWSAGWELYVPGLKEEHYTIQPLFEGNINFAYVEELCSIRNRQGEQVGVCFAELLPGVHNPSRLSDGLKLFRQIEY